MLRPRAVRGFGARMHCVALRRVRDSRSGPASVKVACRYSSREKKRRNGSRWRHTQLSWSNAKSCAWPLQSC
eukprot:3656915-Pleurochrysis_carterae.AAC.1